VDKNPKNPVSADDAVRHLKSGMKIFIHGAAATPTPLLEAMCRRQDLRDVELYHMHTEGPAPFLADDCRDRFMSISLFTGSPASSAVQQGVADFIPVFLSDIPSLFRDGVIRLDAALLQLSPPDCHGFCSLGTSVDAARAAADRAPILIAEINQRMPRTHRHGTVPLKSLTAFTETNRPLHEHLVQESSPRGGMCTGWLRNTEQPISTDCHCDSGQTG